MFCNSLDLHLPDSFRVSSVELAQAATAQPEGKTCISVLPFAEHGAALRSLPATPSAVRPILAQPREAELVRKVLTAIGGSATAPCLKPRLVLPRPRHRAPPAAALPALRLRCSFPVSMHSRDEFVSVLSGHSYLETLILRGLITLVS